MTRLSRRRTLALIGGGVVVAAGSAAGGFLATRSPSRALAPWDAAGEYADPRMRALSWAILAPNPHNRQPWLVDLGTPDTVILLRDEDRLLPVTDPFGRQIAIGLGCFLEQMIVAASVDGLAVELDLYPQGEGPGRPVAVARFRTGASADPLAAHMLARRSLKEPMDLLRPVSPEALAAATAAAASLARADATAEPGRVEALRRLTWDAWMIEAETPAAFQESVDLMRFGRAEIEANPDGIDLGGPFLETLMLTGMLTREAQADPTSQAYRTGVDIYREMLAATPAYVWLATEGNARGDQIGAGRAWLRLNLATTGLGLGLHPIGQCLQEFPEMAAPYAEAHEMLGRPGETVQMLGRLGYGPEAPRTPRWPLESRLIHA
jgi:hypothetical protein